MIDASGSGFPNSFAGIKDLLEPIVRLAGVDGHIVWDMTKPNSQPRRKLDVSREQERFGFASATPFENGLRRAINRRRMSAAKMLATEALFEPHATMTLIDVPTPAWAIG